MPRTGRGCPACRRDRVAGLAAAADRSLPRAAVAAAVDAVAPGGQALWHLEQALAAGPQALSLGAPPLAGRLAAELIARGSADLAVCACAACGRTGLPLTHGDAGPVCPRCRAWQLAAACSGCGRIKPVATRSAAGQPLCEVCRRRTGRGSRRCGSCGKTAPVAVRGRGGQPDICVNCYRMPEAVCAVCRPAPRVQLRHDQPPGLPVLLAEGDRHLRALRPGPPAPGPLARRAGLRPVLHRRAAAPGTVRVLRPAAAPGHPAGPGR